MLIVIGIGGSYLGARAAIEFVNGQFYNQTRPEGIPEVYFAGNNISSSYLNDIIKMIGDRDFCINIISKSGTTTEPAIAFRELKKPVSYTHLCSICDSADSAAASSGLSKSTI